MGTFGLAPFAEVMSKSKALAERALAIDPGLAEAWATLGAVEEQYARDFVRSDSLYDRALELEPRNATARAQWALWRAIRRAMPDEEAVAQLRRAVHDDPLNAWVAAMRSYLLGILGRNGESIAEAERALGLDTESFFARWNLMRAYAWAGNYDRAIGEGPALLGDSGRHPWALGLLAWTYARAGQSDHARACYDELEGRSRHEFVSPCWLSVTAGCADLEELALRWAERAVADHDPILLWSIRLPFWEYQRVRPRFREVMREVWG
jgi:tetratricopeptide (TPR) repeat protein